VSKVANMSSMFGGAISFNQPVGEWDVSSVTSMESMFEGAEDFMRTVRACTPSRAFNLNVAFCDPVVFARAAGYIHLISGMARASESSFITAENYYLLHWLYRIRNVSCRRGLKISFLQPDFLWSIYRPMMRSKKWRTDDDIRVAADLWCFDRAAAEERYGHISDWDVSSVTDMSSLFQGEDVLEPMEDRFRGKDLFNDDISRWDVSNVTCMCYMFAGAESFNQPVGDWDVSKVTNMGGMFKGAHSFNQPMRDWKVSKVTNIETMFYCAYAFNQDLTRWDIDFEGDADTNDMFYSAHAMLTDNKPFALQDEVNFMDNEDENEVEGEEWEEWDQDELP
jgi:surface protein